VFIDIFDKWCENNGVAPTRVMLDLKMGKSNVSKWREGHEPSNATRKLIADYFKVTVDQLMAIKTEKPTDIIGELSIEEKEMITKFRKMSPAARKMTLKQARAVSSTD